MALEIEEDHELELELEQHLVDKIRQIINEEPGEPKAVVAGLATFYSFKEEVASLLDVLARKTNPKAKGDWPSIRRGNLYALNNLVNEWQITKKHPSLFAAVYDANYENIKKSLKKIKSEISGDEGDGSVSHHQEPDHPNFERHKGEVYRCSSRFPPRKFHGIQHKVLAMERELVLRNKDAPFKVFGVVGVAGIGKTTLCQAIFARDAVKERYSPRIWVCISKQPKDKSSDYRVEIVVRILKCLGIDDKTIDNALNDANYGLKRLILLLRLQLIEKRYLIVLDDAWNDDKFFHNLIQEDPLDDTWGEELAYALPKGCGGTIISSSTSETLLKNMLGKDVYMEYLKELENEIIYEIFKDAVIGYDEDEREFSLDLDVLKEELLIKCAGVPFAAKLLAKIACKQLEIKPKVQQTTMGGEEGSHDIKQASTSGVEQPKYGDGGLPMVSHNQMASTSGNK